VKYMEDTKRFVAKGIFAIIILIIGMIINTFVPTAEFFGYKSVGTYLIFCGVFILALALLRNFVFKPKKYDERMTITALKSTRLTFVIVVFAAAFLMILDGIKPITLSYSLFLSYFVCFILLCSVIIYKIMLKYY
jgi:hypothetical protein